MNKKFHVLILLFACLVSFSNIFTNEFIFDDDAFIVNNPDSTVLRASTFFEPHFGLYRPLRSFLYYGMFQISGLNPVGYHILSIALHIGVTLLIYLIITELFNEKLAFFASLLFAVHPLHVERVSWMTASFDLLGVLLYVGSFYLYILSKKNKKLLIPSIIVFILGLFSSEEVFTLPLMILVYEFIWKKKSFEYKKSIPYFIFLGIFLFFRIVVLNIGKRVPEYPGGSFLVSMLTMPKVILSYISLTIVPINLSPFRAVDFVTEWFDPFFLVSILILAGLILLVNRYRTKLVLFSAGWFVVTLLPFLNISPLQKIMAERYVYLASLSVMLLVAALVIHLNKKTVTAAFIAGVVLFSGLTFYNNTFLKDEFTFMSRGVEVNPFSSKAHNNLGSWYFEEGDVENALDHYRKASQYDPENVKAWINLGVIYSTLQEPKKSVEALERAIELTPANFEAYDKLGVTYFRLGQYDNAKNAFARALFFNEEYYPAMNHLAVILEREGDHERAIQLLQKALDVNPYYAEGHQNLGLLYKNIGATEQAQTHLKIAAVLQEGS